MDQDKNSLWKPIAVTASIFFLYFGVIIKLARDWWSDANYSHGLLVPFVIGFIVWTEWDSIRGQIGRPPKLIGAATVFAAFGLLLGGTLGAELFTQRISLVMMVLGLVIWFLGAPILRLLVVPAALLVLSIPIPQIIFNKIAFPLQIWASQAAVWGIRLFEIPTVRKGNVIEILPNGATQVMALEVVEACSGIRSLMTLVTLALILGYFTRSRRSPMFSSLRDAARDSDLWRIAVLMAAAIPIAVLTNAARVTATGVMTYQVGRRATEGLWHDASGWLVYVAALALLIGVNAILKRFLPASTAEAVPVPPAGAGLRTASVIPAIALVILGGIAVNWFDRRGEQTVDRRSLTELSTTLGDWRQKGDEIRFGEATESVLRVSDYTMREYLTPDGRLANIYVGYYSSQRSGATYHSPQNCLPGAGWVMKEPELIDIPRPDGTSFKANRYIIENGIYKEVMIYWYQGRGRTEASEYSDKINTVWDSVVRRRSDGAMVRVMTSVGNDMEGATKAAIDLAKELAGRLDEFVPE